MSTYQRPNIQRMQGYSWGEQPKDGQAIKLNTNENPYPPSPHVAAALNDFATTELRTYPQPTADALRERIAHLHGLSRNQVVITHAGDEALRLAVTTYVSPVARSPVQTQVIPFIQYSHRSRTRNLLTSIWNPTGRSLRTSQPKPLRRMRNLLAW